MNKFDIISNVILSERDERNNIVKLNLSNMILLLKKGVAKTNQIYLIINDDDFIRSNKTIVKQTIIEIYNDIVYLILPIITDITFIEESLNIELIPIVIKVQDIENGSEEIHRGYINKTWLNEKLTQFNVKVSLVNNAVKIKSTIVDINKTMLSIFSQDFEQASKIYPNYLKIWNEFYNMGLHYKILPTNDYDIFKTAAYNAGVKKYKSENKMYLKINTNKRKPNII